MSQSLTPIPPGIQTVGTAVSPDRQRSYVFSQAYIEANGLQERPTEWETNKRPIYRRLPAISETYQSFFEGDADIGYAFIPWSINYDGPGSLAVAPGENDKSIIVYGGEIVWKYGSTVVNPVLIDFETIDVVPGRYTLAYELVYDRSPQVVSYEVNDFSLQGLPLDIDASTDQVPGWRFNSVNAFISETDRYWTNTDTTFKGLASTSPPVLKWSTDTPAQLTEIKMGIPSGFFIQSDLKLTLEVRVGNNWVLASNGSILTENFTNYYYFKIEDPAPSTGWRVRWKAGNIVPTVAVNRVLVSGIVTKLSQPLGPTPRAGLVMYPQNQLPKETELADGSKVPATYCTLAQVDIGKLQNLLAIDDARDVTRRRFQPIADWMTEYWDQSLSDNFTEVKNYAERWMSPKTSLFAQYNSLQNVGITVV